MSTNPRQSEPNTAAFEERLHKLAPPVVACLLSRALRRGTALLSTIPDLSPVVAIWLDDVVEAIDASAEQNLPILASPRTRNWVFARKWIAQLVGAARQSALACTKDPISISDLASALQLLSHSVHSYDAMLTDEFLSSVDADIKLAAKISESESPTEVVKELAIEKLWQVAKPSGWPLPARYRRNGALATIELTVEEMQALESAGSSKVIEEAIRLIESKKNLDSLSFQVDHSLSADIEPRDKTLLEIVLMPKEPNTPREHAVSAARILPSILTSKSKLQLATLRLRRQSVSVRADPPREAARLSMSFLIDPGESTEEDVEELFFALNDLCQTMGGGTLSFGIDGSGFLVSAGAKV